MFYGWDLYHIKLENEQEMDWIEKKNTKQNRNHSTQSAVDDHNKQQILLKLTQNKLHDGS